MNKNGSPAVSLCEKYLPAKKRMLRNKKDIAMYRKKLETEVTTFERLLLEDCIAHKEQEIEEDYETISMFDMAVQLLEDNEKELILQMYGNGIKWSEIHDKDGDIMHPQTVARIRKKAFARIQNYLDHIVNQWNRKNVIPSEV